jgi:hypothetical protein
MPRPVGSQFTQQRRRYKYDFKKLGGQDLTDGQVWRLDKGKDYECGEDNLRQHVRRFATDHNLDFGLQILKSERGGVTGVEVAFVPHGAPLPGGLDESAGQGRRRNGDEGDGGESHGGPGGDFGG